MDPHDDDPLVGLAAALAGEPALAAELLAEVEVLSPAAGGDDELPQSQRALLVQRFLRRRPPRPATAHPEPIEQGEHIEHPDLIEELHRVRHRLDRLDLFPRAILVLRHHQRLLVAELAGLVDRSPAAVTRALDAAEAAVAADPYTLALLLAQAPRPQPEAVRAAARRFRALRRRRRGQVVLAALTVAVLLVGASVLPRLLRPAPYARSHGEWVYGFALAPSAAFTVEGRSLSAGDDVLTLTWSGNGGTNCDVTVSTALDPISIPTGRAVQVNHRAARFLPPTDQDFGVLWLLVGPRTAARIDCEVRVEDATLLELAGLLRFAPVPVQLPFALRDLPAPDEVRTVFDYRGSVGAILTPAGQLEGSPDTLYLSVPDLFGIPREPTSVVEIRGARGEVIEGVDGQSVCWPADGKRICAGTFPQDATGNQKDRLLDRLVRTARLLDLAPDLDDRSTWFDAREALPPS